VPAAAYHEGITNGVTGAVGFVFWGLVCASGREIDRESDDASFRRGSVIALVGNASVSSPEYFLIMATVPHYRGRPFGGGRQRHRDQPYWIKRFLEAMTESFRLWDPYAMLPC